MSAKIQVTLNDQKADKNKIVSVTTRPVLHEGVKVAHLWEPWLHVLNVNFHAVLEFPYVFRTNVSLDLAEGLRQGLQLKGVPIPLRKFLDVEHEGSEGRN